MSEGNSPKEMKVMPNSHKLWEVEYEYTDPDPDEDPELLGPQIMSVWVDTEEQARKEAEMSLTAIELMGGVAPEFIIHSVRLVSETQGMIFVFGSNLSGIHGAGAAKFALEKHGAEWGVGEGPTGRSYALPTKEADVATTRDINEIAASAQRFDEYAFNHPELTFQLTAVGCGLAGLKVEDIAPLFVFSPDNVKLPPEFRKVLAALPDKRFWNYPGDSV